VRSGSGARAPARPASNKICARLDGSDERNEFVTDVILKRFESPDEVREMVKGKFALVHIAGMTIGRATYQPGWKWSEHVGPSIGALRCTVEHVGLVLSGTATAALEDGRVVELRAGDLFHIPAIPHDSWVVGNEPYVSLHFFGADNYAKK
jgi:quercetin dioxygenase-like cupin family protein